MGLLEFLSYWDFVRVSLVTKHGHIGVSRQNVTTVAKYSFKSAPKFDIIVVPGGHVVDAMYDLETINFIK